MENRLIQKLYGFKRGKTWRVNFLCVSRGLEISKFRSIKFFIVNRKNIKFKVKKVSNHTLNGDTHSTLID